jgi:hypothetical protein
VEVVVAGISALIALVALVVSVVVARRQTAIQERVAAIEEARRAEEVAARTRAQVTARISRGDPDPELVLRNEGPALARGVEALVGCFSWGPSSPPVIGLDVLPVDFQPGQDMRFPIPVALGDSVMLRVLVRWTDGAGEHEQPFALKTQ